MDPARRARWTASGGTDPFGLPADYGVPVVDVRSADSVDDVVAAADAVGYPVVLKTVAALHKSDIGAVVLGIPGEAAPREAYATMADSLGPAVTVEPMVAADVEISRRAALWWSCSPTGWWPARRCRMPVPAACSTAWSGRILGMAWDFSTDPDFQRKLDWVEEFCKEEVEPLEFVFPYAVRSPDPKVKAYVRGLQQQIKDQGLWALFLDEELGGPGFGQLKLALLNEIIGRYSGAPQMFGAAAPDTGNMEMLAAFGTEEQKKRWLEPLLNQDMFSAYSMTEPQGGSDPNLFKTTAVRDGDEWVINGEKWFTSAGRVADILFVMCTNGMFVVPRTTQGVEIQPEPRNHNHIIYRDVRVPLDHLLGPEDGAQTLAQRRLGGGRIHHAMRTIAQCKLAFDMMCERALSRESHGKVIGEHQMVQEKIADSYAAIRMLRLLVLETAWKIDNSSTKEARTDIATVKFTMAKVLREVSFNALHILGSLGTTDLTPLQAMYASAPTMGLADGADEVHKATVARRVLRDYSPQQHPYWPTEYLPAKRAAAWEKFEPKFEADPELRASADAYKKYFRNRR